MLHVEQTEGSQYLLVFEVRNRPPWAEMHTSLHGVGHFIELSDNKEKEAGEVLSERVLWF